MRKEILALVSSAIALATFAARAQVGAIEPDRSHYEHDYEHEQEQEKRQKYTCQMHPEVVMDHPGNCPKCGIKLVPKAGRKRPMSNVQLSTYNARCEWNGNAAA